MPSIRSRSSGWRARGGHGSSRQVPTKGTRPVSVRVRLSPRPPREDHRSVRDALHVRPGEASGQGRSARPRLGRGPGSKQQPLPDGRSTAPPAPTAAPRARTRLNARWASVRRPLMDPAAVASCRNPQNRPKAVRGRRPLGFHGVFPAGRLGRTAVGRRSCADEERRVRPRSAAETSFGSSCPWPRCSIPTSAP